MPLPAWVKERMEMAGYQYGSSCRFPNNAECYRSCLWSEEEYQAYKKGFDQGIEYAKRKRKVTANA